VAEACPGRPARELPPERRRVGLVFQDYALFPHLSVRRNVAFGLPRGGDRERRADKALAMVGLDGLGDRMPAQLSGGQQQRVALARALAPRPSVVLLDEPFGSLDAALRDEIRSEVAAVLRASEATSLLVTHDQEEALSMAETVAVMRSGVIVQHGPPHDVYRRPADLWVANFVGRANILVGHAAADGTVQTALGVLHTIDGPGTGDVDVVIRPEQLQLVVSAGGPDVATVEDRRYFGHDVVVGVCLAGGERLLVRLASADPVPVGSTVTVSCPEPVLAFAATAR